MVDFFKTAWVGKYFRTNPGHKMGKSGADHGLRKFDMLRQASAVALVFFRNGCGDKFLAQTVGPRRGSEVLALGWESLTFPGKLRRLNFLFGNGCGDKCLRPSLGHKTGQ